MDPWTCPRPARRSPARSRARRAPRPGRRPCPPPSPPAPLESPSDPWRPAHLGTDHLGTDHLGTDHLGEPDRRAHGAGIEPPATEETDATESEADEGVPAWLWWVAGLALLGAALAAILLPRARRRSAWDTDLAAQQDEVTWFARELVPALQQAGSPDAVAGGWQVAAARVTRAEDKLTGLESTAPDEARGSRARSLRDAVRAARLGIEHLIVSRDPVTQPRDLGVIGEPVAGSTRPGGPDGSQ